MTREEKLRELKEAVAASLKMQAATKGAAEAVKKSQELLTTISEAAGGAFANEARLRHELGLVGAKLDPANWTVT